MVFLKIPMIHVSTKLPINTKLEICKIAREKITIALRAIQSYRMRDHHQTLFLKNA